MAKIAVLPTIPSPLAETRFAQNGDVPAQSALRRVARTYNHVASNQRKLIFAQAHDPQSTPAMTDADDGTAVCLFRTGENVESIAIMMGLAPASATNGTSQAVIRPTLYDSVGSIIGPEFHYHTVQAGIYAPSEVAWVWGEITTDDGLLPNTEYRMIFNQYNFARMQSVMVYETALSSMLSTVDGVADPLAFESAKPIYDANIQDLAETGTLLWRHNAAQLISFSRKTNVVTDCPTPNSTTWENILSSTVSAYSASAPGYHLATQYHDSFSGDIPVTLGVYATRLSGTGTLEVKLEQASGTLLTRTGISSSGTPFDSSTHTIAAAATPTKTDILVRCSDNTTEWCISAIGLWEYEA